MADKVNKLEEETKLKAQKNVDMIQKNVELGEIIKELTK